MGYQLTGLLVCFLNPAFPSCDGLRSKSSNSKAKDTRLVNRSAGVCANVTDGYILYSFRTWHAF